MASLSRRSTASFNLSFLDIMFCGFGAVVLLVLLINSNIITNQQEKVEDRRLELMKQEITTDQAQQRNDQLREMSRALDEELNALTIKENALVETIEKISGGSAQSNERAELDLKITSLKEELSLLEQQVRSFEKQLAADKQTGDAVRSFIGRGDRQYLTGLKLGGKRILILIDSSASMLERRIVDIIRLKILDEEKRRSAPKWQRAVATVEWLLAKLPASSSVQLYQFNRDVTSLAANQSRSWHPITDNSLIDPMIKRLKRIAPSGGTNLESPFQLARTITPRPDNIILLTDGLPTQGMRPSTKKTISGQERVKLFAKALKFLPADVPVNIILFPVEGDPLASFHYWQLALNSGGSFLTPTKDWP